MIRHRQVIGIGKVLFGGFGLFIDEWKDRNREKAGGSGTQRRRLLINQQQICYQIFVAMTDSMCLELPEVILSTQRPAFKVAMRHLIRVLTVLSFLWLNRGNSYAADKIIADFGGLGAFQSTTWVARDLKIFDKYGLDVDLVMITGGARSVAALLGGSTQISTGSATTPILASARSSEVAIIAAAYNHFPFSFVSKPEIKSPKELRGKKLAILNFGGSHDLAYQLAFREWGLKRQEVNIIPLGDQPTRLSALLTGNVDATIMSMPHLMVAVKAGYRVLGDMGEMRVNFSQSTAYLRRSYLRDNRDIAKRFVKAYSEATYVLRTDRQRSLAVMARRLRIENQEILNATYEDVARRFTFPPRVNMAGMKDTLDFFGEKNPELKGRRPEEFVDETLLDELEKEGFFKSLAKH